MAILRTIGVSGDYPTIAAWMSDLTNGAVYTAGDTAIGEVIDWSAVCAVTLPTVGVLPASVVLRPAANRRHSGRIGTGCRLLPRSSAAAVTVGVITYNFTLEGFEIDYELAWNTTNVGSVHIVGGSGNAGTWIVSDLICYGFTTAGGSTAYGILVAGSFTGPAITVQNCAVFSLRRSSTFGATVGICATRGHAHTIINCSVFDTQNISTGTAAGFSTTTATIIQNCVSIGNKTSDFSGSVSSASNNASGDSTAPGTSAITGITEQQFAALRGGDARLLAGNPLIGAGVNVGLTTDLAGNAFASPPSIGPLEFVASSGGSTIIVIED